MHKKVFLMVCIGLLSLACCQKTSRITDPMEVNDLSFRIVDCNEAEEFFQKEQNSFAKPSGYYACICPAKALPFTELTFTLPEATSVSLVVKVATGYNIKTLIDETLSAGVHVINWDNKNDKGEIVEPGIYIYALRTGTGYKADSFIILKH
jgi:hypothetical protein